MSDKSDPSKRKSGILTPLIIIVVIILVGVVETQTYFIERLGGQYQNWRNKDRDAYGTTWVRQQQSSTAAQQIGEEAAQVSRIRREAELVSSFDELLSIVPDGEGVSISPDKFIALYRDLPQSLRPDIIDPTELLNLRQESRWRRTLIRHVGSGSYALMVDDRNRVIHRNIPLTRPFLDAAKAFGHATMGELTDIPTFTGQIFTADSFFAIYFDLSEDRRETLLPDPDVILGLPQPVIRVGLAPAENDDDYGLIGFESEGMDGVSVITYPASSVVLRWIVNRLTFGDLDSLIVDTPSDAPDDSLLDDSIHSDFPIPASSHEIDR